MGLEELTFDVEGVKLYIKPELQMYHNHAEHNPFIGIVPVRVVYKDGEDTVTKEGMQRYDTGKGIFLNALSDYVPTDFNNTELLEKYGQGMKEAANAYTLMWRATSFYTYLNKGKLITEKHFYKNSQGDWKDLGDCWLGVESDQELREWADRVK